MNPAINEHFDNIEARLVASPVVATFSVLRREVRDSERNNHPSYL